MNYNYICKMKKTIVYNMKSLPEDVTIEEVLEIHATTGFLIYEGKEPYIVDVDNLDQDIVVIRYKEWLNLNSQTQQKTFYSE